MDQKLFEIICEQIQAINELTAAIQNGGGGVGNGKIVTLPQKLSFTNGLASLDANPYRQGFIAVNKTDDIVYGIAAQEEASVDRFTWMIASDGSEYYIPSNGTYTGDVNFKAVGVGYLMVTEFSFQQG